jgi:hypothetical protein
MRRLIFIVGLLVMASVILIACSDTNSSDDTSSVKPVNIELETTPDPPSTGVVELSLLIKDERGNPIEGAQVDVSVDHTDMTGMEMSGPATEQGDGKYAIDADFSMSGNWKMTVYVRNDVLDYKEEIDLKIK